MSPDELRALADRVRYAATLLMRPGMPSSYWDACNRAADYLRLQAHTHPAQAEPKRDVWEPDELEQIIDNYVADYELNDGEVFRDPTDEDRFMIKDAIMGLLADPTWDQVWGALIDTQVLKKAEPKREPLSDAQLASVCLSYRHDFGLLNKDEQARLMLEARDWERAFRKEWQREPLSEDEISKLAWKQNIWTDGMVEFSFIAFAREIENAHGIGGSDE